MLSTIRKYEELVTKLTVNVSCKTLPKFVSYKVPALSSLILPLYPPLDADELINTQLFDKLVKLRDNPDELSEELSDLLQTTDSSVTREFCAFPLDAAFKIAKSFIESNLSKINLLAVYEFIDLWYSETEDERIHELSAFIKQVETEKEEVYQSVLSGINSTDSENLYDDTEYGFGLFD